MSAARHTPGPWTFKHAPGAGLGVFADVRKALGERYSKDCPVWHVSNDYVGMCISYELWTQFPRKEWDSMQVANGRLIAAAPELLQALKEAVEIIEGEFPGTWQVGRAAIAKAEGGTA